MPRRRPKKPSTIPRELNRAGALCLAFANSGTPRRDDRRRGSQAPPKAALETYGDLVAWGRKMGALEASEGQRLIRVAPEHPGEAAAVLIQAVGLRPVLRRIFMATAGKREPKPEDLELLNAAIGQRRVVPATPQFQLDWAGGPDALGRALWPISQSAVELLASERLVKVRRCPAKGCLQLFVQNDPRRVWCDANTCGSHAKGKRYQHFLKGIDAQNNRQRQEKRQEWLAKRAEDAKAESS